MIKVLCAVSALFVVLAGAADAHPLKESHVHPTWKVEEGVKDEANPRLRAPDGAQACHQVEASFSCRGRKAVSGTARCMPGESRAACCRRVAGTARKSCARTGGVASFKCACIGADGNPQASKSGKKGGKVEYEWKVEEGEK